MPAYIVFYCTRQMDATHLSHLIVNYKCLPSYMYDSKPKI